MEKYIDSPVQERLPGVGKEAAVPAVQTLQFYHGGTEAVPLVRNVQGVDGELLCASTSPNVARRYGEAVSRFSIAEKVNIRTMSLLEWFVPNMTLQPGELLTDRLRDEGVDAVVVLGSDESYDFPAPTLFVLTPEAVRFEALMSPIELTILDDGRSYVMDPEGPDARGWELWMRDFGEDLPAYTDQPEDSSETESPGM